MSRVPAAASTVPGLGTNTGHGLDVMETAASGLPSSFETWMDAFATDTVDMTADVSRGLVDIALRVGIMLWLRREVVLRTPEMG